MKRWINYKKDQVSVNIAKRQLRDLSSKIGIDVQPVYTSKKLEQDLKLTLTLTLTLTLWRHQYGCRSGTSRKPIHYFNSSPSDFVSEAYPMKPCKSTEDM